MPEPGESRDDFVSRCVPTVLDDGSAEDQDQAVAMCNSMWEHEQDDKSESESDDASTPNSHAEFTKRIAARSLHSHEFGYGVTTAESYARALLRLEESGAKTGRTTSPEQLIKESSERLCYCVPEMVAEKLSGTMDGLGLKDQIATPPNTLMVIQHVLTTDREDRDGDVLRTAGAELDPKAPLLWQHQPFMPIGKVLKTIEQTKDRLRVVSALLDLNELTSDIAKLIEADALRFSHGFRVLDYEPLKNKDGDETGGFEVKRFEILEASLVSVPSNVDAEIELFSRGKLESDLFRAHAKHFADQRSVVVPGADIPETVEEPVDDKSLDASHGKPSEPDDCKAGRVLSARNMDALQEVLDDLRELAGMELARSGKALVDRCISKLESVLKSAKPESEEDKKDVVADSAGHTVAVETTTVPLPQIELTDVVNYVLGASQGDLARVKQYLDLVFDLTAYNAAGDEYREFSRTFDLDKERQ